jgi:hypothetical protein
MNQELFAIYEKEKELIDELALGISQFDKSLQKSICDAALPSSVPCSIFDPSIPPLEAVVLYLREQGLRKSEIAAMLRRDQRTIWKILFLAERRGLQLVIKESVDIPIAAIANRKLSTMENIISYLVEKKNYSLSETAHTLKRESKAVWLLYSRAKRKRGIR